MVLNPHDFHCLNMHDIVTTVDAVKKTFGVGKYIANVKLEYSF